MARSRSAVSFPILRVGFIALIEYCGMIDTSLKRRAFMARSSPIGSSAPSRTAVPPTWRIRPSSRMRLLPSVVFPQPDSPARPMISPSSSPKVTPSRARTSPRMVR